VFAGDHTAEVGSHSAGARSREERARHVRANEQIAADASHDEFFGAYEEAVQGKGLNEGGFGENDRRLRG
jgi:hypothetical protein